MPGPGHWAGHLLETSEKKTFRGQGKHRFLPKVHASSSSLPGLQCPYSALPLQQSPSGISEAALDAPRVPGENWAWGGHWAIQFTKPSSQQVPFALTMPPNPCFFWNYSLLQPWGCSWPAGQPPFGPTPSGEGLGVLALLVSSSQAPLGVCLPCLNPGSVRALKQRSGCQPNCSGSSGALRKGWGLGI